MALNSVDSGCYLVDDCGFVDGWFLGFFDGFMDCCASLDSESGI